MNSWMVCNGLNPLRSWELPLALTLLCHPQVDEIIGACSGSVHALLILRSHGLSREALNAVAEATTVVVGVPIAHWISDNALAWRARGSEFEPFSHRLRVLLFILITSGIQKTNM